MSKTILTDISNINQQQYMNMLQFTIKNGNNLLIFGPAGVGKTEMAIQACNNMNIEYRYVNLSVLEAPDLMGLPIVDNKSTSYAIPAKFQTDKEIVLIVDEIDKSKPELQNPCLELFQFRSINGTKLNIKAVIATANLPDENAFSEPLSHALTDRCAVYRLQHAFEPWRNWAVNNEVDPLIVGFLAKHPDFLLKPPDSGDDTAYCHPTPRSWTMASKDLKALPHQEKTNIDLKTLLISGRVGIGAAIKLRVWLEFYKELEGPIEKLVTLGKHPGKLSFDKQMIMAIGSIGSVVSGSYGKRSKDEIDMYFNNILGWLKKIPKDAKISAIKSNLDIMSIHKFNLSDNKEFLDILQEIDEIFSLDVRSTK